MSKYQLLWEHISGSGEAKLLLSFEEAETVSGVKMDHSFLNCKKELLDYGYRVEKISLKNQTILFVKEEN